MSCAEACPLEAKPFDDLSPGVVSNDEVIYRSVFADHIGNKNKIRTKAINNKELLQHETLSFWRAYSENADEVKSAEDKLRANTPADRVLAKKFRPTALSIRELRTIDGARMFCVIDDVRTDYESGKDALHAGVRLCEGLKPLDANDPVYAYARDSLLAVLELTSVDLSSSP